MPVTIEDKLPQALTEADHNTSKKILKHVKHAAKNIIESKKNSDSLDQVPIYSFLLILGMLDPHITARPIYQKLLFWQFLI